MGRRYRIPANQPECPQAHPSPGTHCSCWFDGLLCCWCRGSRAEEIRTYLNSLDGSTAASVSLLTDIPVDQLKEYGGLE